jgi:hypothetical protein
MLQSNFANAGRLGPTTSWSATRENGDLHQICRPPILVEGIQQIKAW